MAASLDRPSLEAAFAEIGARAIADGRVVEIAVYGGAALVLTLDNRVATKDLDAVIRNDPQWLRAVVAELAEDRNWPADWLNDGVKGFLSDHDASPEAHRLFKSYPSEDRPGLRVFVATPAYLFAMKCMAMRIGGAETTRDRQDIEALAKILSIADAEKAIELVARFYPASRISPKTQFGIEEIFGPRPESPSSSGWQK
jgi:hypothetical protein